MTYTQDEQNLIVFAGMEELSDRQKHNLIFECKDGEERKNYLIKS